jgi:hypothetical protein
LATALVPVLVFVLVLVALVMATKPLQQWSPCRKLFHENPTKTSMSDVSFSSAFFGLSRFRVSAMGNQQHPDIRLYQELDQELDQGRTKNPKPIFSRFVLSRFWAFLGEGSSKTR